LLHQLAFGPMPVGVLYWRVIARVPGEEASPPWTSLTSPARVQHDQGFRHETLSRCNGLKTMG